jgi:hypothetical protein
MMPISAVPDAFRSLPAVKGKPFAYFAKTQFIEIKQTLRYTEFLLHMLIQEIGRANRESHLLGKMIRSLRCAILLDQGCAKSDCSVDEVTDSGRC